MWARLCLACGLVFGLTMLSQGVHGSLRPRDIPPDPIFSNWTSVDVFEYAHGYGGPAGTTQRVSHGLVQQNGKNPANSHFNVLHSVVFEEEAIAILNALHSNSSRRETVVPLDDDPDTVDGMTTHEIFLDNLELRRGLPSKASNLAIVRIF